MSSMTVMALAGCGTIPTSIKTVESHKVSGKTSINKFLTTATKSFSSDRSRYYTKTDKNGKSVVVYTYGYDKNPNVAGAVMFTVQNKQVSADGPISQDILSENLTQAKQLINTGWNKYSKKKKQQRGDIVAFYPFLFSSSTTSGSTVSKSSVKSSSPSTFTEEESSSGSSSSSEDSGSVSVGGDE